MKTTLSAFVVAALLVGCGGGTTAAGGSPAGEPPVVGIYSSCPSETLEQTYASPSGFTMGYPSTWTGANQGSTYYDLTTPYRYVPTGQTAPVLAQSNLEVETGTTATSDQDVQTRLYDISHAFSDSVVRSYDIGGHPAVAWWYDWPPPQPGCAGCSGDPGPDYITIGVAFGRGLDVVEVFGSARVDAPAQVFCDIQASEGSIGIQ
jgi:hypothetical protein